MGIAATNIALRQIETLLEPPPEVVMISETSIEGFRAIHWAHINAVIAKTDPSGQALQTARELAEKRIRPEQLVVTNDDPPELVAAELDEVWNLGPESGYDFYRTIIRSVEIFQSVMRRRFLGVRLETIATDNCSHFHVDFVPMRLIQTLWGPATEWLPEYKLDRLALRERRHSETLRKGFEPERLETGWIALMKGEKYVTDDGRPKAGRSFVHRSPPILAPDQPRLLLRIDEIIE